MMVMLVMVTAPVIVAVMLMTVMATVVATFSYSRRRLPRGSHIHYHYGIWSPKPE